MLHYYSSIEIIILSKFQKWNAQMPALPYWNTVQLISSILFEIVLLNKLKSKFDDKKTNKMFYSAYRPCQVFIVPCVLNRRVSI